MTVEQWLWTRTVGEVRAVWLWLCAGDARYEQHARAVLEQYQP